MEVKQTAAFQIRKNYAELRKSEKKVADYILQNGMSCRKISLEELADRSGVSQPTVVRFVKAVGYESFKEFRYRLIEDLKYGDEKTEACGMYGYSLKEEEKLKDIPAKVIATSINSIENMMMSISGEEFEKAICMLAKARRIVICCVENSSAAARDLMIKLLYLGYDCRYDEDYYLQNVVAAALTPEDVMIGISYSGQSKDTVDVMKHAKKSGASTICITNFKESKISRWGDVVLCSSQKQWMYGDAIFSRSTQMVINDMIYMGLLVNDYAIRTEKLDANSRIISDKAYQS